MSPKRRAVVARIDQSVTAAKKRYDRSAIFRRLLSAIFDTQPQSRQRSRRRRDRRVVGLHHTSVKPALQAIESLEDRLLLSAAHSLYDGRYIGTFSGTGISADSNGNQTKYPIPGPTLSNNETDVTVTNGVLSYSTPGDSGSGTGVVDSQGNLTATVSGTGTALNTGGQPFTAEFVGQAQITAAGVQFTGTWTYQQNFSDGSTDTGSGTWTIQQLPGQLVVSSQPKDHVITGQQFEIDIQALDSLDNVNTDFNGPVSVAIANNPGNTALAGTQTVDAVDGVAKFTDLTISTPA